MFRRKTIIKKSRKSVVVPKLKEIENRTDENRVHGYKTNNLLVNHLRRQEAEAKVPRVRIVFSNYSHIKVAAPERMKEKEYSKPRSRHGSLISEENQNEHRNSKRLWRKLSVVNSVIAKFKDSSTPDGEAHKRLTSIQNGFSKRSLNSSHSTELSFKRSNRRLSVSAKQSVHLIHTFNSTRRASISIRVTTPIKKNPLADILPSGTRPRSPKDASSTPVREQQLAECKVILDRFYQKGMKINHLTVKKALVRPEEIIHPLPPVDKKPMYRRQSLPLYGMDSTTSLTDDDDDYSESETESDSSSSSERLTLHKRKKKKKVDHELVNEARGRRVLRAASRNKKHWFNYPNIVALPLIWDQDTGIHDVGERSKKTRVNSWWTGEEYKEMRRKMKKKERSPPRVILPRPHSNRIKPNLRPLGNSLDSLAIKPTESKQRAAHIHNLVSSDKTTWFPSRPVTSTHFPQIIPGKNATEDSWRQRLETIHLSENYSKYRPNVLL